MSGCIGEPVSQLRLERYHLGELSQDERRDVARHLERCTACRACLEHIQRDSREPQLADLAAALAFAAHASSLPGLAPTGQRATAAGARRSSTWVGWAGAALGASLALGLWFASKPSQPGEGERAGTQRAHLNVNVNVNVNVKGQSDSLALEVIRMDAQGRLLDPGGFVPGDRFKLLLSCAPALRGTLRVIAFQAGRAFEPVPPQPLTSCGNRRALSGAWQFDGARPVELCVVLMTAGPLADAALVADARSPDALPEPRVCARLLPAAAR